jgi:hypothetical protein
VKERFGQVELGTEENQASEIANDFASVFITGRHHRQGLGRKAVHDLLQELGRHLNVAVPLLRLLRDPDVVLHEAAHEVLGGKRCRWTGRHGVGSVHLTVDVWLVELPGVRIRSEHVRGLFPGRLANAVLGRRIATVVVHQVITPRHAPEHAVRVRDEMFGLLVLVQIAAEVIE